LSLKAASGGAGREKMKGYAMSQSNATSLPEPGKPKLLDQVLADGARPSASARRSVAR